MYRILTASSILALAAVPAIAQQADPMTTPAPTEAPATSEMAPAPEPIAQPEPAAPAAAPSREANVAKVVETEFPAYDADKSGELSEAEFSAWVLALHSKAEEAGGTSKKDPAAKAKWAKDAFATADVDKNKKVSKAEIGKFLLG